MKLFLVLLYIWGVSGRSFEFFNNLQFEIWVGSQGNTNFPAPENGGWVMSPGSRKTIDVPEHWEGRFWPRTGCNSDNNHCETGDCGDKLECAGAGGIPPYTIAEITLQKDYDLDYYDISLVNGFNVMTSIRPINGQSDGSARSCQPSYCSQDLNPQCPGDLQDKNSAGAIVACNSACDVYHTEQYCCSGNHNDPQSCPPTEQSKYFSDRCPNAYSYAYDDPAGLFTCKGASYLITFGG